METKETRCHPKPVVNATCLLGNKGCYENGKCHYLGNCEHKVLTNADRIRAMSDEKLAKWMSCGATMSVGVCGYCKNSKLASCDGIPCEEKTDAEIILEWLKQPAEVE